MSDNLKKQKYGDIEDRISVIFNKNINENKNKNKNKKTMSMFSRYFNKNKKTTDIVDMTTDIVDYMTANANAIANMTDSFIPSYVRISYT